VLSKGRSSGQHVEVKVKNLSLRIKGQRSGTWADLVCGFLGDEFAHVSLHHAAVVVDLAGV